MSNTETTFATIIIGVKHNKLSVVRSTIGTSGIIDTDLSSDPPIGPVFKNRPFSRV